MFRQESMYWLAGYDTSGKNMFRGIYLRADGALAWLTRAPICGKRVRPG
jgi:Xaa-Pro dipeptidase